MDRLNEVDISNFLPHRAPFLLVDKVLTLEDDHVTTTFEIKEDSIFVVEGVFTEVGLIENAAQTCSAILGSTYFDSKYVVAKNNKIIGFISAIKRVNISHCPRVGGLIVSKAVLQSRFDTGDYKISTIKCTSYTDEKELLSCEINLFIKELK
jgi:predicted hotdog family 3-hydroxylacyl-ACP dehydratase